MLRPDCQIAYTHFSPSAESLARTIAADFTDYLPYDLPGQVGAVLDALAPDLLVFTKLDLWPELATAASRRDVPVALVAGTVRPGSGRLGWPVRSWLAPGYGALTAAAVVSDADATRLARLGTPADRISVIGDPRFDSVLRVPQQVSRDEPLLGFGHGAPTMVAGSTWPEDESVLLQAFARLHLSHPDARLILVPHEPTPVHLDRIDAAAHRLGLPSPMRLSDACEPVPLLVVDRTGVLATLYGAATMAYVGGGFGRAGLHSVLEPAAWSIPVVVGPRWQESRDAELLLEAGAAEALAELGTVEPDELLQRIWEAWITDDARRLAQGQRARRVVEDGAGAAEASAAMLAALLPAATSVREPLVRRS